ncbi:sigma-70 family RNA polymerase sigma factor [Sporosarcina sp. Sa2YVA2]|uniref:Sigma-70 family RNA polymerase sigma factor n=1 Tax=Sporosarcina quadrami TaxID=2762234 RepID=A0ABR8U8S4_9BACL|nr:sigma-70 family RNA polymerase sigma factor [Sporosarcina quadrami]MBD7984428.1 sigma-70 family RNA polymerase sigma factor [Sporosarcina quadrami]
MIEQQLIQDYRPLLASVAKKYAFLAEYEDLFTEGVIALLVAYRKFDEGAGIPIAGYLSQHVRFAVQIKARELNSPVYIPHKTNAIMHAIRRRGLGDNSVEEISEQLKQSKSEVKRALLAYKNSRLKSLDALLGEESSLLDVIVTEDDKTNLTVDDFINLLSDRQKVMLGLMYKDATQNEIAKALNISQSQVGRDIAKIRQLYTKWEGVN